SYQITRLPSPAAGRYWLPRLQEKRSSFPPVIGIWNSLGRSRLRGVSPGLTLTVTVVSTASSQTTRGASGPSGTSAVVPVPSVAARMTPALPSPSVSVSQTTCREVMTGLPENDGPPPVPGTSGSTTSVRLATSYTAGVERPAPPSSQTRTYATLPSSTE